MRVSRQDGLKGDSGDAGPNGDTGEAGPKRDTGEQGPAGPVGAHIHFRMADFSVSSAT